MQHLDRERAHRIRLANIGQARHTVASRRQSLKHRSGCFLVLAEVEARALHRPLQAPRQSR